MKKLIKQTLGYSIVFGIVAFIAPVAVAASDARQINLYGIDTSRIASTATALSAIELFAVVASVVVGTVLIANGKFLKKFLNK